MSVLPVLSSRSQMKTSGELTYGQVPALRVGGKDGVLLVQSSAILKFIGKKVYSSYYILQEGK